MTTMVPGLLPAGIAERIAAFLCGKKTGQIILHIKSGEIMQVDANEVMKVKRDALDTMT